MSLLGNGLSAAKHHEETLSVQEAELAMLRRVGDSEHNILVMQGNLAMTYQALGRFDEALRMRRDVYSGRLKLNGEEHETTLRAANNYADSLVNLERFEEAKALMRKTMPVARRVLGEGDRLTLKMRMIYALQRRRSHARRSPRVRDDARGDDTDRAARARGCAPGHNEY